MVGLYKDLLRSVLKIGPVEGIFSHLTTNKEALSFVGKLAPRHYSYPAQSIRKVNRYGLNWSLDISELVGWHVFFGFQESAHDKMINLVNPGDQILDVGGNMGLTALRLAQECGPTGHVYAFEPHPLNIGRFKENHKLNPGIKNLTLIESGVGAAAGNATLSVIDYANLGKTRILKDASNKKSLESVEIGITTIDSFVEKQKIKNVHFIKMDIEGFEYEALKGAVETLKRWKPKLLIEVNDDFLKQNGSSASMLLSMLRELGYELSNAGTGESIDNSEDHAFDVLAI